MSPLPNMDRSLPPDIELKVWPEFYEEIASNRKRYEIRKDDRQFAVGSVLHLREWNPKTGAYTMRASRRRVLYLMRDFSGLEKGYVLLSIAPLIDDDQAQRAALVAANDNATARARELAATQRELEKARAADRETHRVFDRMWDADQRAIRDWQDAHPGNDLVWPSRNKLVTWIIPRLQAAEDMLQQIHDYAHDHSTGPAVPDHLWHVRGLAQAVIDPVGHERERVVTVLQTPPAPPNGDAPSAAPLTVGDCVAPLTVGAGVAQILCDTGDPQVSHAQLLENFNRVTTELRIVQFVKGTLEANIQREIAASANLATKLNAAEKDASYWESGYDKLFKACSARIMERDAARIELADAKATAAHNLEAAQRAEARVKQLENVENKSHAEEEARWVKAALDAEAERDRLAARVAELEKIDAWHQECMAYCATGPAGVIHTIKSIHERMLHAEREVARLASPLAWIPVAQELPPLDDNPVGAGGASGWSRWLECQNDQNTTDDGPIVFTAAYSYTMNRWRAVGNVATTVTHWRRYQPVQKA